MAIPPRIRRSLAGQLQQLAAVEGTEPLGSGRWGGSRLHDARADTDSCRSPISTTIAHHLAWGGPNKHQCFDSVHRAVDGHANAP